MKKTLVNRFPRTPYNGSSALIIVLCFLVLLTVLVLALLSRSVTSGLISQASANVSKSDLYAHGAIDQILGDLRQEIAAGSMVASVTPSTGGPASVASPTGVFTNAMGVVSYIYRPSSPTNAVPALQGPSGYASTAGNVLSTPIASTVWNSEFPNLVKESTRLVPFYAGLDGNAPTRAAGVNSANDPSRNGRSISTTRWNKPLMLPKASMSMSTSTSGTSISGDTGVAATPVADFVAPDWVLTTADGNNPTTLDTSSSLTTSSVNSKSPKYVIGRYAYAIYNEGGLLDANVAGGPGSGNITTAILATKFNSTRSPSGLTPLSTFMSRKGSEAFADLTQIPGIASLGGASREQQVVDSLVGWRNNASIQPTTPDSAMSAGPLSYKIGTAAIMSNYFNYLIGNTVRFMTTANSTSNPATGLSDQFFTSRQQMIAFFQNLGAIGPSPTTEQPYLQDAMMYLTSFSRALNQPSYWPDPTRPTVVSPGGIASAAGNTAYQLDNTFNPPFKSIRVLSSFTRQDGSTAVVGDPLVRKRFALNRICWLTCDGPIATDSGALNMGDSNISTLISYYENTCGIPAAFLAEGGPTNIKNYFGLTWTVGAAGATLPGGYWTYNHGLNDIVGNLGEDANIPRESDFFELLKASINCGSIAKSLNTIGSSTYTQIQDTTVSCQILQIGANIIDEANPTQYPTHIVYAFSTVSPPDYRSVYGAMDLPYYSSMAPVAYIVQASTNNPLPITSNQNEPQATTNALFNSTQRGPTTNPTPIPTNPVGLFSKAEGTGVVMNVPSIWNPYDGNGPANPTGIAPTSFRIDIVSALPLANTTLNPATPTWPSLPGNTNGALYGFYVESSYSPSAVPSGAPTANTTITTNFGFNPPVVTTNSVTYPNTPWPGGAYVYSAWPNDGSAALTFSNPSSTTLYREPTVLLRSGIPALSNLTNDAANAIYSCFGAAPANGYPSTASEVTVSSVTNTFLGFVAQTFPLRWSQRAVPTTTPQTNFIYNANGIWINNPAWTVRMEYSSGSVWIPYMEYSVASQYDAFVPLLESGTAAAPYLLTPQANSTSQGSMWNDNRNGCPFAPFANPETVQWDPRSGRWGNPYDTSRRPFIDATSTTSTTAMTNSLPLTDMTVTLQPLATGYSGSHSAGTNMTAWGSYEPSGGVTFGLKQQNFWSTPSTTPSTDFYCDPDGTVRRASGAYVDGTGTPNPGNINGSVAWTWTAKTQVGLMLSTAATINATVSGITQTTPTPPYSQSRPIILHRPFRSVAELGYVFSDTPFKNIDFFTPESGYSALLDTFCIGEDYRPDAVAAGQFDLNTKQAPVIQALLSGAYRDEEFGVTTPPAYAAANLSATEAVTLSQALVTRTMNTTTASKGPLMNVADLVGRWTTGSTRGSLAAPIGWGSSPTPYDGFSADLAYATGGTGYTATTGNTASGNYNILQRFRETSMRALADAGQAGTWDLMIDVVAQSGRYPTGASGLSDFVVEGERRYWVHVAIDRSTGQIIDENIEPVNE